MRENETEAVGPADQWADEEAWPDQACEDRCEDADEIGRNGAAGTRRRRSLASMAVRRSLGVAIALAMAYGVFHVVFRTDVLAPALVYVGPVKDGIDWVLADPRRAWMALAALAIPHIGAYYLIFEDRR